MSTFAGGARDPSRPDRPDAAFERWRRACCAVTGLGLGLPSASPSSSSDRGSRRAGSCAPQSAHRYRYRFSRDLGMGMGMGTMPMPFVRAPSEKAEDPKLAQSAITEADAVSSESDGSVGGAPSSLADAPAALWTDHQETDEERRDRERCEQWRDELVRTSEYSLFPPPPFLERT